MSFYAEFETRAATQRYDAVLEEVRRQHQVDPHLDGKAAR